MCFLKLFFYLVCFFDFFLLNLDIWPLLVLGKCSSLLVSYFLTQFTIETFAWYDDKLPLMTSREKKKNSDDVYISC